MKLIPAYAGLFEKFYSNIIGRPFTCKIEKEKEEDTIVLTYFQFHPSKRTFGKQCP
jgi:hypothetical protein